MKKVLLLVLVAIGCYLGLTDYGRSLTKRAWGNVARHPEISVDFDALNPDIAEKDLPQRFASLKTQCRSEKSALGDRVCEADIRAFNEIPADYVIFFFKDENLTAVKLSVKGKDHPLLKEKLKTEFGEWREIGNKDEYGYPVIGWTVTRGVLAISETVEKENEATVLWMSKRGLYQ